MRVRIPILIRVKTREGEHVTSRHEDLIPQTRENVGIQFDIGSIGNTANHCADLIREADEIAA